MSGHAHPLDEEDDEPNPIAGRGGPTWWQWLLLVALVAAVFLVMLYARAWLNAWVEQNAKRDQKMTYEQGQPWTQPAPKQEPERRPAPLPGPTASPQAQPEAKPQVNLPPYADPAVKAPMGWGQLRNEGVGQGFQQAAAAGGSGAGAGPGGQPRDALAERLVPTRLNGVEAARESDPERTISSGRFIQCNQQSRINNALPGMVTATIPEDVWSDGGHVRLIDAGSRIKGTLQTGSVNGIPRVFVLWEQIQGPAPDFVKIDVDSPAADELGTAGLDGVLNRHFAQKLAGAFLASMATGGTEAAINALGNILASHNGNNSSTQNLYQFQAAGQQASETLTRSLVDIPDTLSRAQGRACSIAVMRDMHFGMYGLRMIGGAR